MQSQQPLPMEDMPLIEVKCGTCGAKTFKHHFYEHMKLCFTNEKRIHACTWPFCNSRFTTEKNLKSHLKNIHVNKIPCSIEGCQSRIKPYKMWEHKNTVHSQFKEQCEICGRLFSKPYLRIHQRRCLAKLQKNVQDQRANHNLMDHQYVRNGQLENNANDVKYLEE